jgi:hypothetical protein
MVIVLDTNMHKEIQLTNKTDPLQHKWESGRTEHRFYAEVAAPITTRSSKRIQMFYLR